MAFVLSPEIDQPTADLLIQLQLQDAGLYFESSKGKSRDPTDEELAFQLQNEELEIISQLLADRRMATSFAAAVQADGCIVAVNQVEEDNACKDRDIARQWTENGCLESSANFESNPATLDDETLAKLQILYVSGMEGYHNIGVMGGGDSETEQAESSAWAARRTGQSLSPWKNCRCEQWDERRLLARAYQLIDREEDRPLAANPPPDIDEPQLEGHLAPETDETHLESQEAQPEQADEESHAAPEASASPCFQTPRDILVARTIQELRENH
ncbi:hypothetical protein KXX44_007791, partial [Aspergillus fumigatus]